jgi:branched-chain amino acid transport system substrate-binding protein
VRSRMSRRLVAVSLVLAAPACTKARGSEEIRIGVSLELTGKGAALGVPEAKALELVTDRINEQGVLGRKVRLVVKDNGSDPAQALNDVETLVRDDDVVGILGASTEATSLSFLDFVEQERVPTISMSSSMRLVQPPEKRRFVFKTPPSGLAVMEVLRQDFAANGVKRVCLLAPDTAYGKLAADMFTVLATTSGITVAGVESYSTTGTDFSAQVARLTAKDPQAIMVGGVMPSVGVVAKNIKNAGFTGRTYFDGWAEGELFAPSVVQGSEGMLMISSSIVAAERTNATTPHLYAQKEFFAEYTRRYQEFSNYAAYAADALTLLVEAIRAAGTTENGKVRDALENIDLDGLSGTYDFSAKNHDGASADGMAVLVVRSGVWDLDQQ